MLASVPLLPAMGTLTPLTLDVLASDSYAIVRWAVINNGNTLLGTLVRVMSEDSRDDVIQEARRVIDCRRNGSDPDSSR